MSLDNQYPESLSEIAAEAYDLSGQLCAGCGDLHALWPYIRLTGASTGVETRRSVLHTALRKHFDRGFHDVLIAGCQDTGLLALVARAGAGHEIKISVLDICETPLELCRRAAQRWSLPITTLRRDLAELDIAAAFDLVLVHGTLHFISADRRLEALKRMLRAMRFAGRLILFFNTSRAASVDARQRGEAEYGDWIVSELKRLNVRLPDSEPILRRRFEGHHLHRQAREGAFSGPRDAELLLQSAGFKVEVCQPIDVDAPRQLEKLIAGIAKRRFFAVSPMPRKIPT
jgi:SAM-dependent methyltransferase